MDAHLDHSFDQYGSRLRGDTHHSKCVSRQYHLHDSHLFHLCLDAGERAWEIPLDHVLEDVLYSLNFLPLIRSSLLGDLMREEELTLEKKEYISLLFLLYGEVLTESIKRRMRQFYLDDFSLSEIAENEKVSRNAIHESLRNGAQKLMKLEKKLHFLEKNQHLSSLVEQLELTENPSQREAVLQKMKGELFYGV